jgi:uncharacterized protein (TIGR00730 family)
MNRIITVFGSSRPVPGEDDYTQAETLGSLLGRSGFTLCNGGYGGTMEASAKGTRSEGGSTIGITISTLGITPNAWIQKTIPMPTLVERLQKLIDLGDGYVVLKGGTGTLLELAMVWELLNKGLMQPKPLICLGEFWRPLVAIMARQLNSEGRSASAEAVKVVESAEEGVQLLREHAR